MESVEFWALLFVQSSKLKHCKSFGLSDTAYVGTVGGVHLDDLALVDEQRHAYLSTCLHRSRFQGVSRCIAFDTRLCVSNLQLNLNRHIREKYSLRRSVRNYIHDLTLLHEIHTVDQVLVNDDVIVSLLIHEVIVLTLFVGELIGATLYAYILQLLTDVETTLDLAAFHYIFQGRTHDRITFTRLNVKEIYAEIQFAIQTDACTFLNVL